MSTGQDFVNSEQKSGEKNGIQARAYWLSFRFLISEKIHCHLENTKSAAEWYTLKYLNTLFLIQQKYILFEDEGMLCGHH